MISQILKSRLVKKQKKTWRQFGRKGLTVI